MGREILWRQAGGGRIAGQGGEARVGIILPLDIGYLSTRLFMAWMAGPGRKMLH
jgi:hypothetical protein